MASTNVKGTGSLCFFLLSTFLVSAPVARSQAFNLVQDSSGSTFFDKWDFAPAPMTFDNTTNGDVFFVTRDQVNSAPADQKLAFTNSNGNAILRVDNFTQIADQDKRNTVRITSQMQFGVGSLFIADMLHIPFGCSVWPSFWTRGINWPQDGEIDIIEGINQNTQNQMALHATEGCLHSKITDPTLQSGIAQELNCNATGNIGCTVLESKPNSFGQSFSQNGGGVFATQFDISGIYIWYWPRAQVPASIKGSMPTSSLSITDWGAPSASYPNTPDGCNIPNFFTAQTLVLEITLCGDWAGADYFAVCGNPPTSTPTLAPGVAPPNPTDIAKTTCYDQRVMGPPSGYNDAFFEIQWLRVYAAGNSSSSSTNSTATGRSSSSGASSAGSQQTAAAGGGTSGSGSPTTAGNATGTGGGSAGTKAQVTWSLLLSALALCLGSVSLLWV